MGPPNDLLISHHNTGLNEGELRVLFSSVGLCPIQAYIVLGFAVRNYVRNVVPYKPYAAKLGILKGALPLSTFLTNLLNRKVVVEVLANHVWQVLVEEVYAKRRDICITRQGAKEGCKRADGGHMSYHERRPFFWRDLVRGQAPLQTPVR